MLKVLVVDDDIDFQELTRMTVQRSGIPMRLIEATDGREAINLLAHSSLSVDLILLDLHMPRMDGFEFLQTYAAQTDATVPVVMLTGSDDSSDRLRTMAFPFVKEYFEKPLTTGDIAELSDLVGQLM